MIDTIDTLDSLLTRQINEGGIPMFNIPTLVYDPTNGGKKEIPNNRLGVSTMITECIMSCLKTNKVGSYSKLITNAWSKVTPSMQPGSEELTGLLHDIAKIACGINHAVDSQKTGFLKELPKELKTEYKADPYSQRFRDANPDNPSDNPKWDEKTMPRGKGAVERMERIIEIQAPAHLDIDTSELSPSTKMLIYAPWGNGRINRGFVSKTLMDLLNQFGKVKLMMDQDGRIGLTNLTAALACANGAFWAAYEAEEDNDLRKTCTKANREDLLRAIYLDFVKTCSDSLEQRGMTQATDDELWHWISNQMVSQFWSNRTNTIKVAGIRSDAAMMKVRSFVLDTFGDVMAEAVILNRREATPAVSDMKSFGMLDVDELDDNDIPAPNFTEEDIPEYIDDDFDYDFAIDC